MRRKHKIISDCAAFKPKEVYVEVPHYIYLFVKETLFLNS